MDETSERQSADNEQPPAGEPGPEPQPQPQQPRARNPFAIPDTTDTEQVAYLRQERRRIAIWGVATGGIMAVLALLCIVLILLAQTQGSS